ncbi:MAG: DHHA1 domain-containing protein [Methanobacteriaceae archaeon]
MLNRADTACEKINEHISNKNIVRIISHNDADGLSAAGVLAKAIKEEGGDFHLTILPRLKNSDVKDLARENYELFIFSDMGSGCLEQINYLNGDVIIADHHPPQYSDNFNEDNLNDSIIHVNPHLFGIDGTRDISGSTTSYLTIRNLAVNNKANMDNCSDNYSNNDETNNKAHKSHLAPLALAGAFGDMQYYEGFHGVNKLVEEDGLNSGAMEIHQDLKIVSKNTEPIYKSLAYTFNPALIDLSGDLSSCVEFLERAGISYGIKFSDLEGEEKDILKDELIKINPAIFGDVYSVPKENSHVQNIEDLSNILDSCGKNKKFGLGASIAIGERDQALDAGIDIQNKYRENLSKGLSWIKREGAVQLDNIQYIYSNDKNIKPLLGPISSISIALKTINEDKPIISLSHLKNDIKVSGRATNELVKQGLDLGIVLKDVSNSFGGQGGGHNIAAGAMVPYSQMENFLRLVDDFVGHQLGET